MNWLHTLWFSYFLPSLYGNGPEDLIHLTILGGAAWFAGKTVRLLHAKMDHIIKHHPDIPEFKG